MTQRRLVPNVAREDAQAARKLAADLSLEQPTSRKWFASIWGAMTPGRSGIIAPLLSNTRARLDEPGVLAGFQARADLRK
jgi:hypothetical protein